MPLFFNRYIYISISTLVFVPRGNLWDECAGELFKSVIMYEPDLATFSTFEDDLARFSRSIETFEFLEGHFLLERERQGHPSRVSRNFAWEFSRIIHRLTVQNQPRVETINIFVTRFVQVFEYFRELYTCFYVLRLALRS